MFGKSINKDISKNFILFEKLKKLLSGKFINHN